MKRAGGCDCISDLNRQLKEYTGDPDAVLEVTFAMNGDCYPWMSAVYRKRKKDGTFQNKGQHQTVIPTYCPFCGRKYEVIEKRRKP